MRKQVAIIVPDNELRNVFSELFEIEGVTQDSFDKLPPVHQLSNYSLWLIDCEQSLLLQQPTSTCLKIIEKSQIIRVFEKPFSVQELIQSCKQLLNLQ